MTMWNYRLVDMTTPENPEDPWIEMNEKVLNEIWINSHELVDMEDGTFRNLFNRHIHANLIIKKCIDIAKNVHMCRDGNAVAEDIKRHFGVE